MINSILNSMKDIPNLSKTRINQKSLMILLESSSLRIIITDNTGQVVYVNWNFALSLGYTREELCSRRFQDITVSTYLPENINKFQNIINKRSDSYYMEKQLIKKNGQIINVRIDAFPFFLDMNDSIHVIGFFQDCTSSVENDKITINTELDKKYNEMPLGILVCDKDKCIVYGNKFAADFLGFSEKEMEKLPLEKILDINQNKKIFSEMMQKKIFDKKLILQDKNRFSLFVHAQIFIYPANIINNEYFFTIIFQDNHYINNKNNKDFRENMLFSDLEKVRESINSFLEDFMDKRQSHTIINLDDYNITNRERTVLALILERKTTKEIAYNLGLAEITIRKYLTSLYQKLKVSGREDLLFLLLGKTIE